MTTARAARSVLSLSWEVPWAVQSPGCPSCCLALLSRGAESAVLQDCPRSAAGRSLITVPFAWRVWQNEVQREGLQWRCGVVMELEGLPVNYPWQSDSYLSDAVSSNILWVLPSPFWRTGILADGCIAVALGVREHSWQSHECRWPPLCNAALWSRRLLWGICCSINGRCTSIPLAFMASQIGKYWLYSALFHRCFVWKREVENWWLWWKTKLHTL